METIHIVQVPKGLAAPASLLDAQNRLLSRFGGEPKADNLQVALNTETTIVVVALSSEHPPQITEDWQDIASEAYVGTLTLVLLETPWHRLAHIEEVIVDNGQEGKGIGARLMQKALEIGREKGVKQFDLTSGPSKVAAQALYEKMGFKKRETNNWRYED